MLKLLSLFSMFLAFSLSSLYAESHLMRFADVSDKYIVFTYEDDLWLVAIDGGPARRITRSDGREIFAKFSPDGQKLAFTAQYDGGNDVYIMDTEGSAPIRLTYHPAGDLVLDWYPDGKYILFRSRREFPFRAHQLYKISIDGGMPQKLPVDRAGLAALSPDGKSLAYNRVSREFRTWKRHKGGTAQDIWMGSMTSMDYKKITTYDGTDNFPLWYEHFIYFTSDRSDGTMNIFRYDVNNGEVKQMTFYKDYDVKYPSLGNGKIVYQYAESIYLLDLKSGITKPVPIEIASDRVLVRSSFVENNRFIGSFGLSPAGKRVVMDIRGEIINLPSEEGASYNLTRTSSSREKNPVWSPDGKWIAFFSDKSGEEELYLADPQGERPWKQLTKNGHGFRTNPIWSPDSRYIIFHDKFMQLNLVDVKSGQHRVIDKSDYDDAWERWGIQDYCWSPDSRWIAYSKMEQSMYESIFLYSLETEKIYRVTTEMTEDWSPSFSRDGRYLFFLSNRTFKPIMGFVDQNHIFLNMAKPYMVILKAGDPSPFREKNDSDNAPEEKAVDRSNKLEIDTRNFVSRTVALPVKNGNLFRLEAVEDGIVYLRKTENEFLKYQTVTDANDGTNLDLYRYSFNDRSDNKLLSGISQYHLSADGKTLIYKSGSKYGVIALGKSKVGDGLLAINNIPIQINKSEEFLQIFNEAWRVERDWFYDKNMHGLNWDKVGDMYRKFIPYCGNRGDVNYLIGEMIAELNAGHTYVYGGDIPHNRHIASGLLGSEIVLNNGYPQIKHIIRVNNWNPQDRSPLYEPGCPIKEGDYILAIDSEPIAKDDNFYRYLVKKAGKTLEITYNSEPNMQGAKTYLIKTLRSESQLRYHEWTEKNARYVEQSSNGQLGYVHIPNMMEDGLIEFARAFYPQYYKKGLIIDVRYNGGGFVSKQIHDRLERTINTYMQPREGKPTPVPERTFGGYLVLLINRDTGSDGEIFSDAWKYRKLGPVIGQRTWGGAVGIEPHQPLIDNGAVTPPQFGEYNPYGHWIIEGHGVEPDIAVVNMPKDVLQGKDDQLDKAIEVLLDMIKKGPKTEFKLPAYPDKSKPALK